MRGAVQRGQYDDEVQAIRPHKYATLHPGLGYFEQHNYGPIAREVLACGSCAAGGTSASCCSEGSGPTCMPATYQYFAVKLLRTHYMLCISQTAPQEDNAKNCCRTQDLYQCCQLHQCSLWCL